MDNSLEKGIEITESPGSTTLSNMSDIQPEPEPFSSTEIDIEAENTTATRCTGKEPCQDDMLGDEQEEIRNDNSTASETTFQNSTGICIDLNDAWESTRERVSDFLSTVVKFTYSYWFS